MYHRYGDLNETKQTPGQFREIKRDDALKLFLEDSTGKDIGGLMLRHFNMDSNSNQRRYPIMFQPATLIEVDRKGTDEENRATSYACSDANTQIQRVARES